MSLNAQNRITLRFTGANNAGDYMRVDSVVVKNVTRSWTETLYYPDTTLQLTVTSPTGIDEAATSNFGITNLRPNPFDGTTRFCLTVPQTSDVHLQITDLNGKFIAGLNENLAAGCFDYEISLSLPATYILLATNGTATTTAKLVNLGSGGSVDIRNVGRSAHATTVQPKTDSQNEFHTGDNMLYTGYATIDGVICVSAAIEQPQRESQNFVLQFDCEPAELLPETFTVGEGENAFSFTMIPVRGGSFLMGAQKDNSGGLNYDANARPDEQPVHRVTLSNYAIGETEVTQALWHAVMGSNPSSSQNGNNYPVESVSWDDICGTDGFLRKLNAQLSEQLGDRHFVLPTEAQWEFAAAGGIAGYNPDGSRKHKYSGGDNIGAVAWYAGNSDHATHPVKGKSANELELYDMTGNVAEWCQDYYGSYLAEAQTNPQGASIGSNRVTRDGSWNNSADRCRVTSRSQFPTGYNVNSLGLRLVLDPLRYEFSDIACDSYSWNDNVYTTSGDYTQTFTAANGCDSIVTLHLTVNQSVTHEFSTGSCDNFTWNGTLYTESGDYTQTLMAANGCDSIVTMHLTITECETFTIGDVTFAMITVPGGSFWMGAQNTNVNSPNYDVEASNAEQPVHRVLLSDYAIAETEVTQALWQAVMGNNPSNYYGADRANHPVERISWDNICGTNGFLHKLNGHLSTQLAGRRFVLPTEAQWEFAAAGGQAGYNPDGSRKHKYSGSDNIEDVAWYNDNSDYTTHPIKGKAANELGLYNMSGNVREWCSDWYGSYSADDQTDPIGASSGSDRVLRGGSWNLGAVYGRVAYRHYYSPSDRRDDVGFRLALAGTTVAPPTSVPVTGVSLNKTSLSLDVGAAETLLATVVPNEATNKAVTWRSSNTAVVTVNNEGRVTAIAAGTATITVTTTDGGFSATCVVTVSTPAPVSTPETFTVNGVSFNMVPVPGGSFLMGAQKTDPNGPNYDADAGDGTGEEPFYTTPEQPVHRVTLSEYAIGETEVTQSLWQAVMGNTVQDQRDLADPSYPLRGEGDDYPMYFVSWDDICGVDGFLEKLNTALAADLGGKHFVLPTEAQWEFAAAGGQAGYNPDGSRKHKYSGSDNLDEVGWWDYYEESTYPVGLKQPNELGLYDMSGNIFEWCSDWYGSYSAYDQTDPTGASSGSDRVARGGGSGGGAVSSRVACRTYVSPSNRCYCGFRLALVQD